MANMKMCDFCGKLKRPELTKTWVHVERTKQRGSCDYEKYSEIDICDFCQSEIRDTLEKFQGIDEGCEINLMELSDLLNKTSRKTLMYILESMPSV